MNISSVYSNQWAAQKLIKPQTQTSSGTNAASGTSSTGGTDAASQFKTFMNKTPDEQARDAWLAAHGITKEQFDAMGSDEKQKLIAEIKREVQQRGKQDAQAAVLKATNILA